NKERPRPVALFSLEMSEAELAQRFIASQAAIKGDDLRKGRLKDESKWRRVLKVAGEYDRSPLFVDDSSDIGILDVRAKARRLHRRHAGRARRRAPCADPRPRRHEPRGGRRRP